VGRHKLSEEEKLRKTISDAQSKLAALTKTEEAKHAPKDEIEPSIDAEEMTKSQMWTLWLRNRDNLHCEPEPTLALVIRGDMNGKLTVDDVLRLKSRIEELHETCLPFYEAALEYLKSKGIPFSLPPTEDTTGLVDIIWEKSNEHLY
jgi:hypothetical protein